MLCKLGYKSLLLVVPDKYGMSTYRSYAVFSPPSCLAGSASRYDLAWAKNDNNFSE